MRRRAAAQDSLWAAMTSAEQAQLVYEAREALFAKTPVLRHNPAIRKTGRILRSTLDQERRSALDERSSAVASRQRPGSDG